MWYILVMKNAPNQDALDQTAKDVIVQLLDITKVRVINERKDDLSIHEYEALTRTGEGYLSAINNLLSSHPRIFNDLIEHPALIELRRFCR
jgi:hypothetical protein